ncbi:hypothetical protein [Pseudolabrys taiwanensis]|uniref:hypothetical protein n=1 Tax=Pseudolabrys taiwanensis TaxID=331696 RepID=UPI0013B40D02|nr:hypothetical protein [Pseudolabrys taiwanensis]
MDSDVLEALKDAADAIDFSRPSNAEHAAERAREDTATRRREFATLMRSIKSMVRESA